MDKEREMFDAKKLRKIQNMAHEFSECGPLHSPWRRANNQLAVAAGRVLVLLEQEEDDED